MTISITKYGGDDNFQKGDNVAFFDEENQDWKLGKVIRVSGDRVRVKWDLKGVAGWVNTKDLVAFVDTDKISSKCECGAAAISADYPHTHYCPLKR